MTNYIIVYVVVWGLVCISMWAGPVAKKYLFLTQVVILALFVALKFETGYDWPVYEAHYLQVSTGDIFNLNFEFGYEILVRVFSFLGFEFHQFIAVVSVVEILLIASAVRFFFPKYCLWIMALMYAIPDFYLIPSFSLVRQGLAVSLFFYGVRCYVGNRKLLPWLVFGLAISFHYSVIGALFFLLLAFKVKISKNVFAILFTVACSLYLLSIDVVRSLVESLVLYLDPKYLIYLQRDVYNASLLYRGMYAAVSLFAFVLLYVSWDRRIFVGERFSSSESSIHRLAMLGVLIPLVVYGFPTFSTRYQYFFCIFTLGVSLTALEFFNARDKLIVFVITCLLACVPFYRFLVSPLSIVYIPYQSQIFYDESNSTGQQRTDDLLNQLDVLWSK